jgi:hypothetical protein
MGLKQMPQSAEPTAQFLRIIEFPIIDDGVSPISCLTGHGLLAALGVDDGQATVE